MYQLESAIAATLAATLGSPWTVLADAGTPGKRDAYPLAVVKFIGAPVGGGSRRGSGVQLRPRFGVQLVVRTDGKSAAAPALLDGAVHAAIGSLHGLAPGAVAGRRWERLALLQVNTPEAAADGLVGCQLVFETDGDYAGNPDSY